MYKNQFFVSKFHCTMFFWQCNCSDSTSDDINWEEEIENETFFYKHGKIKEPEAYDVLNQVHIFYNQKLPKTLELMPEEYSKSFFFLMTIENINNNFETEPNKTKAWQDFVEGIFYSIFNSYMIFFWHIFFSNFL